MSTESARVKKLVTWLLLIALLVYLSPVILAGVVVALVALQE